jgi:hypothetical protein
MISKSIDQRALQLSHRMLGQQPDIKRWKGYIEAGGSPNMMHPTPPSQKTFKSVFLSLKSITTSKHLISSEVVLQIIFALLI